MNVSLLTHTPGSCLMMTRFWVIYDWISRRQQGGQSELQAVKIQHKFLSFKHFKKYEICHNSNSDWISYLHKLLAVSKTESPDVSTNLQLKKQCCKSRQTAWSMWSLIFFQYSCTEWSMWFSVVSMQQFTLIHFIFLSYFNFISL